MKSQTRVDMVVAWSPLGASSSTRIASNILDIVGGYARKRRRSSGTYS